MEQKSAYYFVTDIETDGPDPALHSMLSFATVVLREDGVFCGEFEGVLKPRPDRVADKGTMNWWAKHPQAWEAATSNAQEPEQVMKRYADWVESFDGVRAFAARPLMFDGLWIDRYLRDFAGCFVLDVGYWGRCIFNASPLDIGTYTSGVFGRTNPHDAGIKLPSDWLGNHPHTHHAIDDARGYASLLSRLFTVARELPPNPHDFTAKSMG
ncbi:hypothetical protein H4S14_003127 [Agrobacterium vitis]|nr:hypothetical protein [Agrobacterium vitis]MBE1439364.1 hypothetical protein [Agrobacterium vitis]